MILIMTIFYLFFLTLDIFFHLKPIYWAVPLILTDFLFFSLAFIVEKRREIKYSMKIHMHISHFIAPAIFFLGGFALRFNLNQTLEAYALFLVCFFLLYIVSFILIKKKKEN